MRPLLMLLLIVGVAGMAEAQTGVVTAPKSGEMKVTEMVFCAAVENRQPTGVDTVFSDTVKQIYCFTRIAGATDTTSVSHVWYFEENEKARVDLSVKSKSWRTWSCKRIPKKWAGRWRVDVISPDGNVIKSGEFLVKPTSD